jgi:hypothetical protein
MIRLMQRAALAAAVTFGAGAAHAACDTAALIEQCEGMLGDGYSVMSTFALDGQDGKVTSVTDDNVLTSRMTYQVAVCSQDGDIEFVLESGAGEQIATNKAGGKFEQVTTIKPARMSVYNLVFSVQPPAALCGGAVLGGKK